MVRLCHPFYTRRNIWGTCVFLVLFAFLCTQNVPLSNINRIWFFLKKKGKTQTRRSAVSMNSLNKENNSLATLRYGNLWVIKIWSLGHAHRPLCSLCLLLVFCFCCVDLFILFSDKLSSKQCCTVWIIRRLQLWSDQLLMEFTLLSQLKRIRVFFI